MPVPRSWSLVHSCVHRCVHPVWRRWDPEESGSHARAVRDAFVTEYGLPRAAVPLLRMHADGPRVRDQPFELADE